MLNILAKKIQYDDNMVPMDRILLCLAEFGGTGILVFLGCLGCASKGAPQPMVQVAFSFGFAILIALQVIHIGTYRITKIHFCSHSYGMILNTVWFNKVCSLKYLIM